jgi:hypothetical protein
MVLTFSILSLEMFSDCYLLYFFSVRYFKTVINDNKLHNKLLFCQHLFL